MIWRAIGSADGADAGVGNLGREIRGSSDFY